MAFDDTMSRISDLVSAFFGAALVTDSIETDIAVGTTVVQLLSNNPRRVAWHLTNTGPTTITIARINTVTPTTGQLIAPGEVLDLYWYNELREIERPWFAISGSAGGAFHSREVVFV